MLKSVQVAQADAMHVRHGPGAPDNQFQYAFQAEA